VAGVFVTVRLQLGMRRGVQVQSTGASVCRLGVLLLAAVTALFAPVAWPGQARVSPQAGSWSAGAWTADLAAGRRTPAWSRTVPGLTSPAPPALHGLAPMLRAVVTPVGPEGSAAASLVLPGLALVVVVASRPRIVRPRAAGQRHRTRAPPVGA